MPRLTIGDHEVYFEVHGDGPRPAALLVMGLGADLHAWERQVPVWSKDRKVVVFDNRGIGRSGKPRGPYTTALLADDAATLAGHLALGQVHVCGISMGGMISQELALRHGAMVRSLTLVATYAKGDAETHGVAERGAQMAGIGGGLAGLKTMLAALEAGPIQIDPRQMMAFMMPMLFSSEFIEKERAWMKTFYERSLGYGFVPEAFGAQVAAVLAHDTTDRLGGLTAPTLIVTGTRDRLVPPRHSRRLHELIPGSRLVELEGATHGLNFERADELNELVGNWFREND